MRILLIAGHGAGDCGAIGNGYRESDLTRELVKMIGSLLNPYASVTIYDTNRNAFKDLKQGSFKVGQFDYALEVHFNAFSKASAKGTEIYVTTAEKTIGVEKRIMQNLSKFFTLRDSDGVKVKDFAVIRNLKAKGISSALLEVCFITNSEDMKIYQGSKVQIAKAITEALKTGLNLTNTSQSTSDGITDHRTHKLKTGDTLWALSVKYLGNGSRWKEIQMINPGLNPDNLPIGQTIKIPAK